MISCRMYLSICANVAQVVSPFFGCSGSGGGGIFCSVGVNGTVGTGCLDGGGVPGGGMSSGSEPAIVF